MRTELTPEKWTRYGLAQEMHTLSHIKEENDTIARIDIGSCSRVFYKVIFVFALNVFVSCWHHFPLHVRLSLLMSS